MIRRRKIRFPQWPFAVEWDDPQAVGLAACYPLFGSMMGGGCLKRDLVSGASLTLSGGTFQVESSHPFGMVPDLLNDGLDGPPPLTTTPLTLCCWAKKESAGAARLAGLHDSAAEAGAEQEFAVGIDNSGLNFAFCKSGASSQTLTGGTVYDNKWHHVAAIFVHATLRYQARDGIKGTQGTTNLNPSPIDTLTIGYQGGMYFGGKMCDVRVYRINPTAALLWQMFAPDTRFNLYRELGKRTTVMMPGGGAAASAAMHGYRQRRSA